MPGHIMVIFNKNLTAIKNNRIIPCILQGRSSFSIVVVLIKLSKFYRILTSFLDVDLFYFFEILIYFYILRLIPYNIVTHQDLACRIQIHHCVTYLFFHIVTDVKFLFFAFLRRRNHIFYWIFNSFLFRPINNIWAIFTFFNVVLEISEIILIKILA